VFQFQTYEGTNKPKLEVTYDLPPTVPTLLTPNGGETYNASATITCSTSTDPDGDAITYDYDYSSDNGANWYSIVTGASTSYTWDTSALTAGSTYLVRVRAYDGITYSGYDQSDGVFTIQHITDRVNINGVLKDVDKRYVNVGGVVKEIDWIKVNINGVLKDT
jgi:hypothetical protein